MASSNNPAPTAASPTTPPRRQYHGVRQEPGGLWAAYVTVDDRAGRLIGHFHKDYRAALAHDRVALFLGAAAINFPPSFSAMELLFLRRRRCGTEEFLLRAVVLDHVYEAAFEDFLRGAFADYRCGEGDDEETAAAVAECVARVRETPEWRRVEGNAAAASHTFVMGHINPVLCGSWVPYFHAMGDPNRSFFTCKEAHEWEAAARRAAAQQEEEEEAQRIKRIELAQQEVKMTLALEGDKEHEELPENSSHAMPRVSTAFRLVKGWLRRSCFSGEQHICDEEQQVPLLKTSRGLGQCRCMPRFDAMPSRRA